MLMPEPIELSVLLPDPIELLVVKPEPIELFVLPPEPRESIAARIFDASFAAVPSSTKPASPA